MRWDAIYLVGSAEVIRESTALRPRGPETGFKEVGRIGNGKSASVYRIMSVPIGSRTTRQGLANAVRRATHRLLNSAPPSLKRGSKNEIRAVWRACAALTHTQANGIFFPNSIFGQSEPRLIPEPLPPDREGGTRNPGSGQPSYVTLSRAMDLESALPTGSNRAAEEPSPGLFRSPKLVVWALHHKHTRTRHL